MKPNIRLLIWGALLVALLTGSALLQIVTWDDNASEYDIYFLFLDGQSLLNGQNPYARVLEGDMRQNDKYTTYFPGFIELAFLTQRFGPKGFLTWLMYWRWVFVFCSLSISTLLFGWGYARGTPAVGLAAAALWAMNRWTLFIVYVLGMDFIPLLLLLISMILVAPHPFTPAGQPAPESAPRWLWWGMLFFGLSLAMKQIAIFLAPLYLIHAWQMARTPRPLEGLIASAKAAALIAAPVLLTSLPFIFWNPLGFVNSILFSLTRSQTQFFQYVPSLDITLQLTGPLARAPMLALFALIYWAAARKEAGFLLACALVMAVFVGTNSIYFDQYMAWAVLPLLAAAVGAAGRRPAARSAITPL